ncbi:hypothetical protein KQH21_31300 [Streptomyces sp. IpFD-1.1]|uniref:DUF6884 domain-containing protein n=1 Tax=unclassified Streptomyces TaxID=2593676 RepID=UPI001C45D5F8|nr:MULTISPECIES: DUF6884 domain-containing protein [unclassified Streptomyces]MBV7255077.1 hypothetical protein [Streptomyces sp. S-2]MCO6752603.1 hypothetical protein [Streptomyces sp. IpFD-1.1]
MRRADGTAAHRPLSDVGFGAERAERYEARLKRYVAASAMEMEPSGHATVHLDLLGVGARRADRAQAALAVAERFGLQVTLTGRRNTGARVHGEAEQVARLVAALPRVLHYAEELASSAARMYGRWTRSRAHSAYFAALEPAQRRAHAREFRAAAYRAVVKVLTGPLEAAAVPEYDPGRLPWDQAEAVAGAIAEYGWVDVRDAYIPAEAVRVLDTAVPSAPAPRSPGRGQLVLLGDLRHTRPRPARPVVVIPCSGAKLDRPAPAGDLYTGPLHTLARQAADALVAGGGTVLVLSALHGLLTLDEKVEPYDHTWKDPGSVTVEELRAQAVRLGLADAPDVVLLTPGEYTRRASAVWPGARTPLAHLGIGKQRGRLAALRDSPGAYRHAQPAYAAAA